METEVQAAKATDPAEDPAKLDKEQKEMLDQLAGTAKDELAKVGVTDKDIADWKQRFGPIEVVFVRTDPIVYKGLNRLEWREIMAMPDMGPLSRLDKEEVVARKCMLYPRTQDFTAPAKAGLATLVFNGVMSLSSFEPSTPAIPL